jgi:hypothetical protein
VKLGAPWSAVLAAALLVPRIANALPYRDEENHAALELPPGWRIMPADRLEAINAAVANSYPIGFEPEGRAPNEYPYVLGRMVVRLSPFASWPEVERETTAWTNGRVDDVKQRMGAALVRIDVFPVEVDRAKNHVVVRTRVQLRDRTLSGYTVGVVGQNGIYYLGASSRDDDTARSKQAVDQMASSFRWDRGLEWKAPVASSPGSVMDWLLPPAIVVAIFAAGVAITKRKAAS